jgi:hypothetical protein
MATSPHAKPAWKNRGCFLHTWAMACRAPGQALAVTPYAAGVSNRESPSHTSLTRVARC